MTVINRRMPSTAPTANAVAHLSLVAGLFTLTGAAALVVVSISTVLPSGKIVWGSIALAVFSIGLLLLMSAAAGYGDLGLTSWRIGPWSLTWGAIAFGLATISWLSPQTGTPVAIWADSILRALWMIGVALTMLTAGYCVGPYRLAAAHARRGSDALSRRFTNEIRSAVVPWVLFGVGIVAQSGFAILTGRLGYVGDAAASVRTASGYSQYLAVAGECVPLAVVAAAIRAYQTRTPGSWLSLGILFVTAIIVGAVAGGKESFVVVMLAALIPRTVARRRPPIVAIIASVLFFLLIVIPFNQAYRSTARGQVTLSTGQAVASSPAIASQVAESDLSPAVLGQSVDYLAERIRTIDSPAIIMQRTPTEIPYSSSAQLLIAPVVDLIPRILWPGKPILTPGYQISQEYYDLPPQIYTASDVTPEGDLYRHGGWIPLVFGMFLIGCALRILDETTDLRRSVHGAFLIVLLFPSIVEAESDCATLLAGVPGVVLLWLAVVALSFTRRSAPAS